MSTTINVTKCENVSREVCHPVTTTECEPECRPVEVVEPTLVQVEECEDKTIRECRNITNQVILISYLRPLTLDINYR